MKRDNRRGKTVASALEMLNSRTVLEQRETHLRTVNNILVLYLGVEKHISVTLIQLKLALDEKSSVKPDSLSSSA